MARRQRVQERALLAPERRGDVHCVLDELPEAVRAALLAAHPEDVEPVLGERAGLVEAADVDLAADVDARGRDAEDAELAKAADGEAGADGEGGGEGGRDDDGDQIQSANDDGVPFELQDSQRRDDRVNSLYVPPSRRISLR